jgi:hypothetical protein
VSNDRGRQRWTPADVGGRRFPTSGTPQPWQSASLVGFGTKRPLGLPNLAVSVSKSGTREWVSVPYDHMRRSADASASSRAEGGSV